MRSGVDREPQVQRGNGLGTPDGAADPRALRGQRGPTGGQDPGLARSVRAALHRAPLVDMTTSGPPHRETLASLSRSRDQARLALERPGPASACTLAHGRQEPSQRAQKSVTGEMLRSGGQLDGEHEGSSYADASGFRARARPAVPGRERPAGGRQVSAQVKESGRPGAQHLEDAGDCLPPG